MNHMRGVCLISIPKSGTMLLSRFLSRITGCPVVFGFDYKLPHALAAELGAGWHPAIRAAARPQSTDEDRMCRRYAQMLARGRGSVERADAVVGGDGLEGVGRAVGNAGVSEAGGVRRLILSDHGYTSFLQFLLNPSQSQIIDPQVILHWAREQGLAPVFLYRSLPDVANSLALFLASGNAFLLSLRSVREAAAVVVELYAPVLAAQTAAWLAAAQQAPLTALSYEQLIRQPEYSVREVCTLGQLPVSDAQPVGDPVGYRSWTYRHAEAGARPAWHDTFTPTQQAQLLRLCSDAGLAA